MKNNSTTLLLKSFFYLSIIAFFVLYLRGIDYDKIVNIRFNVLLLLLASICSLAFRYWGVFVWRTILQDLGARDLPKFSTLGAIYSKAWMGRYIPGSVAWIAGKIYLASSIGISKSRLAIASITEAGVQIVSITIISLLLIGFDPRTDVVPLPLKICLVAGSITLAAFLHPKLFNLLMRIGFEKIKKKKAYSELKTNNKTIARSFVLYAAGSFISGTSYFLLTKSIEPTTSLNLYIYLVGAFNLAGVIGMATPFVPSGIGVRDGAQLVLLSIVFPKEIALVITILSRLWSAAVDVLFFAFAQLNNKLTTKKDI